MPKPSPLIEVIQNLIAYEDEQVVFVFDQIENVTPSTPALIDSDESHPFDAAGPEPGYFLEVGTAKEVLGVWSDWRGGRTPDRIEAVEAVIYYAKNDAYQPLP